MRSLVLSFLKMSLWGGVAALGVLAVCEVLRRCCAPSRFLCWLWLAAGARFVLPDGIPVTLPRPRSERLAVAVDTVEGLARPAVSPMAAPALPASPAASQYTGLTVWHLAAFLWLTGVLVLLVRAVWGYARLRRSVSTVCKAPDGCFGGVPTPFTLGIVQPRIYLPDSLTGSARETVRRHEETHIRRGDTLTKPLFYAVACLHWFNPLAWLAFYQFERTMESACDEAAVRGRTARERTLYCETLLQFATRSRPVPGSLAFGQGTVQRRIGHLLRCRRLGAGALAACAAAVALSATACMVRPTMEPAAGIPTAEPTAEPPAQAQEESVPAVLTLEEMAGQFANPVPDYTYISCYMGDGHKGDDLCAAKGADVLAAADGVVLTAEYNYSLGYYVIIDHGTLGDGHRWCSLYAHMDDLAVETGDTVSAGQLVGHVGSTGQSTGNHLHFELERDEQLMPPSCFTAYREEDTTPCDGTLNEAVAP